MREAVREHLISVARRGETTTYAGVARAAGLDVDEAADRERLAAALREISTAEHAAGRPMLSAVVVLGGRRRPGRGFFDLARSLGVHPGSDDEAFFAGELDRVHRAWRTDAEQRR